MARQILDRSGHRLCGRYAAHLFYRQKKKLGDAWLLFGERARARDLYYWRRARRLAGRRHARRAPTWCFRADSQARGKYVQHLVADAGGEIGAFVERGASVLVCGGLGAWRPGCRTALVGILGEEKLGTDDAGRSLPPGYLLALQLRFVLSSESMGHHDLGDHGWLAERLRRRWSCGHRRCGM